jgi:hypothetical protein
VSEEVLVSDDWGDIEYDGTRMGRRAAAGSGGGKRSGGGLGREERFIITLAAAAALMLVIGVAIGFAVGRASAPKPPAPQALATTTPEPTTTPVAETTVSAEVTVPTEPTTEATTPVVEPTATAEPLKAPNQISPDDYDKINADKVTLKWSKITGAVTYAFEIQTRVNGKWTNDQVIDGISKTSYSARVLTNLRRWRVWAIDENGKAGTKSGWSRYSHTVVKSSTPSTSTTGTTH